MNTKPIAVQDDSESMMRIIELAPQVKRRSQFFLWSQGDLQRWIPHKLLVCGVYERASKGLVFDVFNSLPLPDSCLAGLMNRDDPLLAAVVHEWRRRRMQPCSVDLESMSHLPTDCSDLARRGYKHVLMHGLTRPGRPDELESVFLFGAPDIRYEQKQAHALEMLLPCLHSAYQRSYVNERQIDGPITMGPAPGTAVQSRSMTDREREILRWVRDGMSNHEIADKLGISKLTVKNHIQKILRKLGASNRAQAVALAMTMNALNTGGAKDV